MGEVGLPINKRRTNYVYNYFCVYQVVMIPEISSIARPTKIFVSWNFINTKQVINFECNYSGGCPDGQR